MTSNPSTPRIAIISDPAFDSNYAVYSSSTVHGDGTTTLHDAVLVHTTEAVDEDGGTLSVTFGGFSPFCFWSADLEVRIPTRVIIAVMALTPAMVERYRAAVADMSTNSPAPPVPPVSLTGRRPS